MHHRHHYVPHEPRAASTPAETVHVTVYVSSPPVPAPSAPASGANTSLPANGGVPQGVTHRVGPPVIGSQTSTQRPPIPSPTYPVPVRQQRRPHTPSSQSVHRTKGSPQVGASSHNKADSPSTTAHHHDHNHGLDSGHHHGASSSSKQATSSSAPASTTSGHFLLSADNHNKDNGPLEASQDQGMSGGAKAGIAIGLLVALALIGGLIFFVYRRKRNQNEAHQPLDDEKIDRNQSPRSLLSSHVSVRRTVANAPRLSLRPVTEMFPAMSEKQDTTSASSLIANSATSAGTKFSHASRNTGANADDASNPFRDDAEAPNTGDYNALTAPAAVVPKPLSIKSERNGSGLSDRLPQSNDPALPASGSAPGARRLSPPGSGPNNVHRVQLDFNPSMDDELGLRAGQLVRMLHEYDDGWALCVRLDRSQQGVVPRTCISKLPVKPRPQGPPPSGRGPSQGRPRGGSNVSVPRGSPSEPRQRQMAPPSGRVRSQSNAHHQPRADFPGPLGGQPGAPQTRPRANSDAMSARRITPPSASLSSSPSTSPSQGGSMPNRKPVPGQAL